MSYYADCEILEFSSIVEPIARSVHKCCECSAPINTGERYVKCSGKWDGDFSMFKQHELCARACEHIRDNSDGECIGFGALLEYYRDVIYHQGWKDKLRPSSHVLRNMLAGILRRKRSNPSNTSSGEKEK